MKTFNYILTILILTIGITSCTDQSKESEIDDTSENAVKSGNHNQDRALAAIGSKFNNTSQTTRVPQKKLKPSEFVKWVKSSHLKKTKSIQEIEYSLNYLPTEYLVFNELKTNKVSSTQLESVSESYNDMEYYELRLRVPTGLEVAKYKLGSSSYEDRIKYLSFELQNDIKAVIETSEEVKCVLSHFERTYNVSPYTTILLGFPKDNLAEAKERTIVLEDKIFGNGIIKFHWTKEQINNIPKVELL